MLVCYQGAHELGKVALLVWTRLEGGKKISTASQFNNKTSPKSKVSFELLLDS